MSRNPGQIVMPVVFPVVPGATGMDAALHRERGYTAGHAAGYTAGLRLAAEEAEQLRRRLEAGHAALADELRGAATAQRSAMQAAGTAFSVAALPLLADSEQTLFECAIALAEAILGHELDDAEPSSRTALTRTLAGSGAAMPARVRMNPLDAAALDSDALETVMLGASTLAGPNIVADPSLARGDAVAEFPDGFLDARISSALDRARRELLGPDA